MRQKGDENLFVEFYTDAVESKMKSDAAGRPVFEDRPFIRITIPGDQHNVIEQVAKPYYQNRFPDEWARFQRNQEQQTEGWPLKTWPVVTSAQVKNLEFLNVRTVEQLANLTDSQCQRVGMDAASLRAKAKAALDAAKDGAASAAQAAENKRLNDELEALKAQFSAALGQVEKRPGRPRKETAEAE